MQDFLLTEDFDLLIENNDLAIGDANDQDIRLALLTHQGEWKSQPLTGVGLQQFIISNDSDGQRLVRAIKVQLKANGFSNIKVDLSNGIDNLEVTADR